MSKWNEVWKTNYTSTKQIDPLISEWLKTYSIDDICSSIERIKFDTYWKDKELDPIWLLRTRDKNGPIDRIGKMLNTDKPAPRLVTSLNF